MRIFILFSLVFHKQTLENSFIVTTRPSPTLPSPTPTYCERATETDVHATMPIIRLQGKLKKKSTLPYDCLQFTNLELYQPPPSPSGDISDIDFASPMKINYSFSLERLLQVEAVYIGISASSAPNKTLSPLQKLSELRSMSSSVSPAAPPSPATATADGVNFLCLSSPRRRRRVPGVASLPSPKDALDMMRRKSTQKIQFRSSRKRARQQQSSALAMTSSVVNTALPANGSVQNIIENVSTNIQHNGKQQESDERCINIVAAPASNADSKRARINLPVFSSFSSSSSDSSSSSSSSSPLTNHINTAENEENQASPLQISITDSTPTKSTLSSSEKAHTPRTPKELEHELDDCKRQLDELKNIVLRLSKKNSVGPEIAQETAS